VSLLELISPPGPGLHRQRVLLDPVLGGRAVSWQVDDLELLGSYDAHWVGHGMYAMAPWAGRLRGNALPDGSAMPTTFQDWAIHGTVAAGPVRVDMCEADRAELSVELSEPWPWPGLVRMLWTLEPAVLHTQIEITSEAEPFAAVVGWHPWFRRRLARGGPAHWELAEGRLAPRDADRMPTAALQRATMSDGPFDDTFYAPGDAVLSWPQALTMRIRNSAPWYVIFDELADFLLVEPQSGPPNGINDPLIGPPSVVAPGCPLVHQVSWELLGDSLGDPA